VNQSQILDSITKYSKSINAQLGYLTDFCNSTSAWLFGNIPHRNFGGQTTNKPGLNISDMIKSSLSTYVFFNLEPEHDFWNTSAVTEALNKSKYNIFFTSYVTPLIERYADVIIPISTFAETDGSFINIEGTYQTYNKIVNPHKNIFEGWSILNSLIKMNNLGDYNISSIRSFLLKSLQNIDFNYSKNKKIKNINSKPITNNYIYKNTLRHIYASDQIVRRSKSLNSTEQSHNKFVYISSDLGQILNNKDILEIRENNKDYKIKNFLIKKELPINTIVYTSSFNNTLNESKSGRITIKS
jgi:NADH-quinone oxidoreductase subunit G